MLYPCYEISADFYSTPLHGFEPLTLAVLTSSTRLVFFIKTLKRRNSKQGINNTSVGFLVIKLPVNQHIKPSGLTEINADVKICNQSIATEVITP